MKENLRSNTSATSPSEAARSGAASTDYYWGKRQKVSYPHLFRLLHWVLIGCLFLLALSGLSLYATGQLGQNTFGSTLPWWLWPGRVHMVHLTVAIVFSASLATVLWVYWRDDNRRRVTNVLLLAGGLVMIATGLTLLYAFGSAGFGETVRMTHAVTGLIVLPVILLWHVLDCLIRRRHRFIPAFHLWTESQWNQLFYVLPALLVAMCLILCGVPMRPPWRDLVAKRIPRIVHSDAVFSGLPWNEAKPLRIRMAGGLGFEGGRTMVTLRALHDGRQLFMLAEWADPTEDRCYMPWQRTTGGWHHQMTSEDDEGLYCEDKFSLCFPTQRDWLFARFGCAAHCHLGGGRAYGAMASSNIVDVWHWKSTRTDPAGQVDDEYWWKVNLAEKDAGRRGDPETGGGYKENFEVGTEHPLFLPDDLKDVEQGTIPKQDARRYTEFRARRIPEHAIVPGVVISAFEGDRGNIRCRSRYTTSGTTGGGWRVRMRRRLDTKSEYDVQLIPGNTYPFGCAVFDHALKRHAYNLSTYRLVLEE